MLDQCFAAIAGSAILTISETFTQIDSSQDLISGVLDMSRAPITSPPRSLPSVPLCPCCWVPRAVGGGAFSPAQRCLKDERWKCATGLAGSVGHATNPRDAGTKVIGATSDEVS